MQPLGKAMKIGHQSKDPDKESLQRVLRSHRQTPHINTGVAPADMFRDGIRMGLEQNSTERTCQIMTFYMHSIKASY